MYNILHNHVFYRNIGWYRTKDLAYYDEFGEIFIVDRIKEIMKYKGRSVSPFEIEDILMSNVNVREAAVAASPVGKDGHRPVAFITKVPGKNVSKHCHKTYFVD